MVGWTNADHFKFIEMYRKEPCIWNPKCKYRKDKVKANDAWLRIAEGMGVSVDEAKRKKETLLAAFRLNHKKVLASRNSGEDEVFKPSWVYYEALADFMADLYETKPVITSEYHVKEEKDEDSVLEDSSIHQTAYVYIPKVSDESSEGEEMDNAAHITPRKRRRMTSSEPTANNVLSEYKKKESEDDCDLYCRLLAKKLRKFSELDRLDLMYQIDGILLKKCKSIDNIS